MTFPAMLRDHDARLAWSDAAKRPNVLIGRFPCALNSLSALDELLAGEAEATKYDTACCVLGTQLPKVPAPSLAAFHQLNQHLAPEGFDLSGATAAERIDVINARDARDDDLRAVAPYGGSGSGGGSSGKKMRSSPTRRRGCTSRLPSRCYRCGLTAPTSLAQSSTRPSRSPRPLAWRPWRASSTRRAPASVR